MTVHNVSVSRRQRCVYLCSWYEDTDGREEWEAFSTLKQAQDWCLGMIQAECDGEPPQGLIWNHETEHTWFAHHEDDADAV